MAEVSALEHSGRCKGGLNRRELLKGFLLAVAQLLPTPAWAVESASPDSPGYLAERLTYKVAFLWYSDVGTVHISLEKGGAGPIYTGMIKTEAKGFVAMLAGNPKYFYQSRIESVPGQNRFRCLEYVQREESGGASRHLKETFDYQKGLRVRTWWKDGQPVKTREFSLPAGTFLDDFLTAFYNFRLQAYGQVRKGAQFEVDTMAKRGTSKIHIKVVGEDGERPEELSVLVSTDQPIFGSKKGMIKLAVAPDLVPRTVTVVSVLGLGDAVGRLTKRERNNLRFP